MQVNKNSDHQLEVLTMAFRMAKARAEMAQETFRQVEGELVELLRERGKKTSTIQVGNEYLRTTVVQRDNLTVNEAGLRKALGAKTFDALCTKRLSKSLLAEAVAKGEIDPVVVAQHSEAAVAKASIRFTVSDKEPTTDD